MIADTRVTWRDNSVSDDVLQKVHAVGPTLLPGFSGSVIGGLQAVADLRQRHADGQAQEPIELAWRTYRELRRIFRALRPEDQRWGLDLLLAGVYSRQGEGAGSVQPIRLRSPEFEPEQLNPNQWTAIGSGGAHQGVFEFRHPEQWMDRFPFELGDVVTSAMLWAVAVGNALADDPQSSIGGGLHVGVAQADRAEVYPTSGARETDSGTVTWDSSKAIQDLAGFERVAQQLGNASGGAAARGGLSPPLAPRHLNHTAKRKAPTA
jgi:hypothetical protein